MDVSIIIVNWNSLELATDCIASLVSTVHNVDYEIIVVDNASQDCRTIVDLYPQVKVVYSPQNIGFAAANNLGYKHSSGANLLFLNPDTIVLGDAVLQMLLALQSSPRIGAIGCRLLNRDRSIQTTSVQRFPTILNQLLSIDILKRRFSRLPLWGLQALHSGSNNGPQEVEVVSGACIMVKRDVFDRIGGFSTEYFMYSEEVDLCYQIWRAGLTVCHVRSVQVVHFGGESSKQTANHFRDVGLRDSVFRFLCKFRGIAYAQAYRFALFLSASLRMAILLPMIMLFWLLRRSERRLFAEQTLNKWRHIASWALSGPAIESIQPVKIS